MKLLIPVNEELFNPDGDTVCYAALSPDVGVSPLFRIPFKILPELQEFGWRTTDLGGF